MHSVPVCLSFNSNQGPPLYSLFNWNWGKWGLTDYIWEVSPLAYQVQENIFPPGRNCPHPHTLLIKVIVFPVSSRDVTNQTLPGRELLNYSRPGRVWLVTSRLGTGKPLFLYSVATQAAGRVSTPVYMCLWFQHSAVANLLCLFVCSDQRGG